MTTYYKVTDEAGRATHGGTGKWTLNRWRTVKPPLEPCVHGLHLCRERDLVLWLGPVIWEAEVAPDAVMVEAPDKVVVSKARVIRRLDTWNERTARLFAADCAERVLPIWERRLPDDGRPRRAIEVARAFARGEATPEERAAAWDAAGAAAWAAGAAAGDAAGAAAGDAVWDAEQEWQTARLMEYLRT